MISIYRVGIREAKAHLSCYLRMVRNGAEIVITDRGKPVGKIVPIATAELPLADRIKRLEDQGMISRRAEKSPRKIPAAIPVAGNIAQKMLQNYRSNG